MRKLILCLLVVLFGCQPARYENPIRTTSLNEVFDRSNIDQYLITKIGDLDHEEAYALFYKGTTYIGEAKLAEGGVNAVQYSMADVYNNCLKLHCTSVITAHNHPTGYFAQMSEVDVKSAKTLWAYLNTYKIELITNIVVTRHDTRWY